MLTTGMFGPFGLWRGALPPRRGYSQQLAIRVCATLRGILFVPIWFEMGFLLCLISLARGMVLVEKR